MEVASRHIPRSTPPSGKTRSELLESVEVGLEVKPRSLLTWAYRATRLQTTWQACTPSRRSGHPDDAGIPRGSNHLPRLLPPEVADGVGHLRHRIPLQSPRADRQPGSEGR